MGPTGKKESAPSPPYATTAVLSQKVNIDMLKSYIESVQKGR